MFFSWLAARKNAHLRIIPADTIPTPTIASCSPTSDVPAGGSSIVITGTGFMAAAPRPDVGTSFVANVWFGLVLATSFTVNSATQITAVASAQSAGTVALVVNTSGGCATLPGFTFAAADAILTEGGDTLTTEAGDSLEPE